MADLVRKLGYQTSHGKNYVAVKARLQKYNISTEHFTTSHGATKIIPPNKIFCKDSLASQKTLRRAYLNIPNVEYKCTECGVTSPWNGRELTLALDHIDGDNRNNTMENLRWLCPNCHSQTRTYAGKNIKKERKKYYCIDCGIEITGQSERCHKCASILRQKTNRPSKDDLEALIKSHNGNFSEVAKIYNITDNSIRKWCKSYGLSTHSKDYKELKPKKVGHLPVKFPVDQIDKITGNVIQSFASIQEAETITGISHIYDASNPNSNRKSAGGFYWRRHEAKPFY